MSKTKQIIANNKGMATIETISLLVLFLLLIGFNLGLFGAIHTGILHSIAARTYAFETFRHRTDLNYFRENPDDSGAAPPLLYHNRLGFRFHTIKSELSETTEFNATERQISLGMTSQIESRDPEIHNEQVNAIVSGSRNTKIGVNPIWIMVKYGMCTTPKCGDE